jgi:hypothetical protein
MRQTKRSSLILLILAGLLIMLLAMGLPGIELARGQPFSLGQTQAEASAAGGSLPGGDLIIWIFRGFTALSLVMLLIYTIVSLLTPKGRRRLVALVLLITILLWVSDYLSQLSKNVTTNPPQQAAGGLPNAEPFLKAAPVTPFTADPPQWLTLAVIGVISLLAVALIIGVIWLLQQRHKSRKPSWSKLAQQAQNALDALHTGTDFKMTIVRCYQEMMRVVKEEKGFARGKAMTPHEFEDHLVNQGLPQEPIRRLTRLFEQVRYGSLPAGTEEEAVAFSCLTDIVNACQSIGETHAAQ